MEETSLKSNISEPCKVPTDICCRNAAGTFVQPLFIFAPKRM